MDAGKALTALRTGDMYALVNSLDADQRHVEFMPEGIVPPELPLPFDSSILAILTRVGCTLVMVSPGGDLDVRRHLSESDAEECFRETVQTIRHGARMLRMVQRMKGMEVELDDEPSQPEVIIVPDDLSSLPWTFGQ